MLMEADNAFSVKIALAINHNVIWILNLITYIRFEYWLSLHTYK